jgi:hypothetical protein
MVVSSSRYFLRDGPRLPPHTHAPMFLTCGARLSDADRRSWLITLSLHDVRDRAGRVLGSSLVQRVTMLYCT